MAGIFDSLFNTQVNNSNNNTSGNTTGRASSNLISDPNYKPPRNTSPWTGKDWFRDPTIPKPPEIQAYYDKHGRLPGNDLNAQPTYMTNATGRTPAPANWTINSFGNNTSSGGD